MKLLAYTAVPGTGAGAITKDDDWTRPSSPFSAFLARHGILNRAAEATHPFVWSTNLNFGRGHKSDWIAGAYGLLYYHVSPHHPAWRIPGKDTHLICHSHGGQVALYAAAFGLKVNTLVTVGTPVVRDMGEIVRLARPNIRRWLHCRSKRDWWQLLGSVFDGRLGFYRDFPQADRSEWMPKGHGNVLRDAELFEPFWVERGLIEFLKEA